MSTRTKRRILRTIAQLIAGGLLYGLSEQIATDVPAAYAPYVVLISTLIVSVSQNLLEDATGTDLLAPREPEPLQ